MVDDEETLGVMAQNMLTSLGYKVLLKTSSREALDVIETMEHEIDLLITDQTMPDMSGVELASKAFHIIPDLPVILYTGFSSTVDGNEARNLGIREFVMKPVSMAELSRVVRKVLDKLPVTHR